MPFAKNVAGKMIQKYPMEFDDAAQAAFLGLMEAADRFDMAKHTHGTVEKHFKAYAYFRIHGAIVDEYRRAQFVSRSAYAKGVRATFVSYDTHEMDDQPVYTIEEFDDSLAVRQALEDLDDREYAVVMGQAIGITGKELSEIFDVDESRISQISIEARAKLKEAVA